MKSTLRLYRIGVSNLTSMICFSFDVDLPLECDDEYMEHPDPQQRFKQPAGKPSVISYFVAQIKLMRLLSFCLRTIVRITCLANFHSY